jgi:hypothetical protein
VRLDHIPQIASATRVSVLWALVAQDGSCLSVSPSDNRAIFVRDPISDQGTILGGVEIGANCWAFRASNGLFLKSGPNGDILADADSPSDHAIFVAESRFGGAVALRHHDRAYLTRTSDGAAVLRTDGSPRPALTTFQLMPY